MSVPSIAMILLKDRQRGGLMPQKGRSAGISLTGRLTGAC